MLHQPNCMTSRSPLEKHDMRAEDVVLPKASRAMQAHMQNGSIMSTVSPTFALPVQLQAAMEDQPRANRRANESHRPTVVQAMHEHVGEQFAASLSTKACYIPGRVNEVSAVQDGNRPHGRCRQACKHTHCQLQKHQAPCGMRLTRAQASLECREHAYCVHGLSRLRVHSQSALEAR
jgi:hypothetical protein